MSNEKMEELKLKHPIAYKVFFFVFMVIIFIVIELIAYNFINGNRHVKDYMFVFFIGLILSAIELGSRYKDEPISVMLCTPGAFYLVVNGLICCVGLFIIQTFGMPDTENASFTPTDAFGTRVLHVLYASLGSFFVMRSSFLKLGSENSQSQIDLGLNLILKKLIDMIDRQVDRDQASRRSRDITNLLKNVSYNSLSIRIHPFCLRVMQNVPPEEIDAFFTELKSIETSDDCDDTKKMAIGLQIYNIVGRKLFESVVRDLQLEDKPDEAGQDSPPETAEGEDFNHSFGEIVDEIQVTSSQT